MEFRWEPEQSRFRDELRTDRMSASGDTAPGSPKE
jgi:hypothetical protein